MTQDEFLKQLNTIDSHITYVMNTVEDRVTGFEGKIKTLEERINSLDRRLSYYEVNGEGAPE